MAQAVNENISLGRSLARGLYEALGDNYEVILYHMHGKDNTIIQVYGKNISGFKNGDNRQEDNYTSIFNQCQKEGALFKSEIKIINGREIKSTIIFLSDSEVIRINFDLSITGSIEAFLKGFIKAGEVYESQPDMQNINVQAILPTLLKEGIRCVGKEVAAMGREDKLNIVRHLDKSGAFLLKNSIEDVAKALDITRFTVYNYLDEIRKDQDV